MAAPRADDVERALEPTHPNLIACRENLAEVLARIGPTDEGEEAERRADTAGGAQGR